MQSGCKGTIRNQPVDCTAKIVLHVGQITILDEQADACLLTASGQNHAVTATACVDLRLYPVGPALDGRQQHFGHADRKSVVEGKGVSERVDLGGRGIIKKK